VSSSEDAELLLSVFLPIASKIERIIESQSRGCDEH
jgi:hypothetical protein